MRKEVEMCDKCGEELGDRRCPICGRSLGKCTPFLKASSNWSQEKGINFYGLDSELCKNCVLTIKETFSNNEIATLLRQKIETLYSVGTATINGVLKAHYELAKKQIEAKQIEAKESVGVK